MPLVVPSPMVAPMGENKSGNPSPRCLGNTGRRRYLVVESDYATDNPRRLEIQAAIKLHLADYFRRPALVLSSGGKSLHTWFPVLSGEDESSLFEFHKRCVALGCDPMTWTPCQLVRTPNAWRDQTRFQQLLYIDHAEIHPS